MSSISIWANVENGFCNHSPVDAVSYSGADGAWGTITSATIGSLAGNALYAYSAHDDGDGRLTESTVKRVSGNATLFDELLSYDPTGNVVGIATTLASGVDHQQFCYDEHNRLTWASATQGATGPCGAIVGGNTIPGASYTQSFGYDTLDRLTSGPAGSYSYGDSAHLHGATQVGSGATAYTASYDAAGDMICRAPTGSTSCSGGANTGQQLTWDLEGRLAAWQDTPSSPTTTASYLYDGEGQRVAQRVTTSGTTTTTTYVGSLAEYITTGGTTTSTDYLYAAGKLVAEAVTSGGTTTLTYLVTNAQGTPLEALDGNGVVTASRLYTPYGSSRYTSGAFPTSYGYTGQRTDTASGLDYYGARYYDPAIGQFTSADMVAVGPSRYAYVGGNPETYTDPTGHMDKPNVSDPDLRTIIDSLWKDTAFWGDKSSMWALLEEAWSGRQIGHRWHYEKVWAAGRAINNWINQTCSSPDYLDACKLGTSGPIDADLVIAAVVLDYINKAIKTWHGSGYHSGTPGKNPPKPIVSAPPLPAPSPGITGQPSVAPPSGIPAQPALPSPAPVPGFDPDSLPKGIWQSENRPIFGLPAVPGFAPANVPPSIWYHEVMDPWTIALLGIGAAIGLYIAWTGTQTGNAGVRPTDGVPGGCVECKFGPDFVPGFGGGGGGTRGVD